MPLNELQPQSLPLSFGPSQALLTTMDIVSTLRRSGASGGALSLVKEICVRTTNIQQSIVCPTVSRIDVSFGVD